MWILNQYRDQLVNLRHCKEIYIVNTFEIEARLGEGPQDNPYCSQLGEYESIPETKQAFQRLTQWIQNPEKEKIFVMPLPRELF